MFLSDGLVWGQSEGHDEELVLPIYGGFVRVHGCLRLCGCRAGHLYQRPLNKLLLRIAVHRRHTLHLARKREKQRGEKATEWQKVRRGECREWETLRHHVKTESSWRTKLHTEPRFIMNPLVMRTWSESHFKDYTFLIWNSFGLNAVWRLLLWSTRRQCHEFRAAINDYCHN